jgi:hypothetical protein
MFEWEYRGWEIYRNIYLKKEVYVDASGEQYVRKKLVSIVTVSSTSVKISSEV